MSNIYQLARVCIQPVRKGQKVAAAIVDTPDYFWFTELGTCLWRDVETFATYPENLNDTTCTLTQNMFRVWVESVNDSYGDTEFNPIQKVIEKSSMEDAFWDTGHSGELMTYVFQAANLLGLEDLMDDEISFGFLLLCDITIDEQRTGYGEWEPVYTINPLGVVDLNQLAQNHKTGADTPAS